MNKDGANDSGKNGIDGKNGEKLNVVPSSVSRLRLKTATLVISLVCIVIGLLYLYTDKIPLPALLVTYCVALCAISAEEIYGVVKSGNKNAGAYISVVVWVLISAAFIAFAVMYFIKADTVTAIACIAP